MSLAFIVSQIVYNESRFFTELLTISNTCVAHFLYIAYFSPKVKLRFPLGEKHGLQCLTALHRRKRLVGFIEPEPVRDHSAEQLLLLFNQVERLESVACTADPDALDFYVLFDDLPEKIDSTVAGRLGKTYRQVCPARPQEGKALMDRGRSPAASTTTSTPRPPVRLRINSLRSSMLVVRRLRRAVAPNAAQSCRRFSEPPVTRIGPPPGAGRRPPRTPPGGPVLE